MCTMSEKMDRKRESTENQGEEREKKGGEITAWMAVTGMGWPAHVARRRGGTQVVARP